MRVIASQKLSRDSGRSIIAARHQGVSQGPLGCGTPLLIIPGLGVENDPDFGLPQMGM